MKALASHARRSALAVLSACSAVKKYTKLGRSKQPALHFIDRQQRRQRQ